jgi:DNA helicase-2/ATP-dependent DNA helicase PcrA
MKSEELLRRLNPEQAAAVSHGSGPLLVLSGAGSGKTRVLTHRLAWLVAQGVPEQAIVALTFTNKAAGEMRERAAALVGADDHGGGTPRRPRSFVGTFHAYGVRLLRRFHEEAGVPKSFVVLDGDDQLTLVKRAMKEQAVPERLVTPRAMLARISQAKNGGIAAREYATVFGEVLGPQVAAVHRLYEKGLSAASALDFDDLLVLSARLLERRPEVLDLMRRSVTHLLVDEFQDTNRIQAALVKRIVGEKGNVFAVGDEDQSIYRWRGADVSNILEFQKEFPGARVVRLERNYRSTASILQAAGAVVAENVRRLGKTLKATRSGGEKVRLAVFDEERDEAREVVSRIAAARRARPGAEIAVLFRTNAQSRPFEDELLRAKIAYVLVGGTRFYERAEVKDALAYLRLARNPDDDISFRRVVNVPARGVGAVTLEALAAAAEENGGSLFAATQEPPPSLTERAKKALSEFRTLVLSLAGATASASAADAVKAVLDRSGLYALYEQSTELEDESRKQNLDELLASAREHDRGAAEGEEEIEGPASPGVAGFLDAVTLRSDADEVDERRGVVLMTLHSAKGLEFDDVFLAGMENGSLPHFSSKEDPEELEEERRLAYVGMTRAKERLTLSRVLRRMVHGEWMDREPSPFLDAIPRSVLQVEDLTTRRNSGLFGGEGGADRFEGGRSGGAFSRGRGSSLFPDYENESQEVSVKRSPRGHEGWDRRPAWKPPAMKRTPPPPTASGFRRGSRVSHPEYGSGVILTIEGSGDAEKVTVYFDRAGRKKFVARFANLSPG